MISVHSLTPYLFKIHFNIISHLPLYLPDVLLQHLNNFSFNFLLVVRFSILCMYAPCGTVPCHMNSSQSRWPAGTTLCEGAAVASNILFLLLSLFDTALNICLCHITFHSVFTGTVIFSDIQRLHYEAHCLLRHYAIYSGTVTNALQELAALSRLLVTFRINILRPCIIRRHIPQTCNS